jgi:hypothetical protein
MAISSESWLTARMMSGEKGMAVGCLGLGRVDFFRFLFSIIGR